MDAKTAIKFATQVTGASIISLDTCTDVKLTGRDNPHKGSITKITSKVRGIILEKTNGYHNLVFKRLIQEGIDPSSYQPSERRWGEHIDNTPLIVHNGNLYLQVITIGRGESRYFCNNKPVEFHDGVMTDHEGYIISGIPKTPKPAEQGGINNKAIVRAYKIGSILEIRGFGKIWR